ncbi:MAG: response regulator [Bacteroidota bacterium]|nr:response regulator [Bacteroidota bacterium]
MKPYNWKNKTIIVVEDDDYNFRYISEVLNRSNPHLIRAKTGLEAFFLSMEYPYPDLVIMDMKLPEMNGYEATQLIKKFRPNLPVIAFTGCVMNAERKKCMEVGCDFYLSKPTLPETLQDAVHEFLAMPAEKPEYQQYSIF